MTHSTKKPILLTHLGGDSEQLQSPYHGVRNQPAHVGHAEPRHRHLAVEGVVPGDLVGGMHVLVRIVVRLHFEAGL